MKNSFSSGSHLHLIDGSHYIFRAYHALPPLTRKSDGLPVGAVSGFCNMLFRYVTESHGPHAPTHVAVIFDKGSHTFRNEIYNQYKANRDEMPEDLRPQIPLTRDATRAFSIACKEVEGFEADDIIATLACKARDAGGRVTIIGSDKDLMQLVGDGIEMFDAMKNVRIDHDGVLKKFGVNPKKVVDVQALAGDSIDNVPGAPGIGIKTAALLINEFGNIESLLDRANEIKQPKRRQTLLENRAQIELSKQLVQLECNMSLDFTLEDLEFQKTDQEKLLTFLSKMEFQTLKRRALKFSGTNEENAQEREENTATSPREFAQIPLSAAKYDCIRNIEALKFWVETIRDFGWVAVDTETDGLDEMQANLVGISLCVIPGHACYIPLLHKTAPVNLLSKNRHAASQVPFEDALNILKPVLEDDSILKIGQNIKFDAKILSRFDIKISPVDDTMLMSFALHSGKHRHNMNTLSETYLDHKPITIKTLLGSGKSARTFDYVPIDEAVKYAAEDADITIRLWKYFKPLLHQSKVTTVYETLERPMISVIAEMEQTGLKVDRDALARLSNSFAIKMSEIEKEIYELAEEKFNIGSPKQLGDILFEKLKLEGGKRGKTGAYATDAKVLENLATEQNLPARVLAWRQLSKLKSTYTDALQEHINPKTNRVHTSYSIAGASTGRLASTDPNLQNIPVRTEEGRKIREAFIAETGKLLVSLDYSQIELRILSHIADITALKEAFDEGIDIHAKTASEVFGVPLVEMTSDCRRRAKAINFGVIYGISAFGLARNLGITKAEAKDFIDRYFKQFPGIRNYMDNTTAFAKKYGYVKTLFGRKIYTPNVNAKGSNASFAQRAAINAPIQGSAADIIRRAMIRMPAAITDLPAKMLLQVHDEETISRASHVMENAAKPSVHLNTKLIVDAGVGKNWAEAH